MTQEEQQSLLEKIEKRNLPCCVYKSRQTNTIIVVIGYIGHDQSLQIFSRYEVKSEREYAKCILQILNDAEQASKLTEKFAQLLPEKEVRTEEKD